MWIDVNWIVKAYEFIIMWEKSLTMKSLKTKKEDNVAE